MTSINLGDTGTATSTAGAATVNHTSGVIVTEALTQATQTTYTFTLTNSCIYTTSQLMVQLSSTAGGWTVQQITISAGSAVIVFRNCSSGSSSGTGLLQFIVL